MKKSIILTVTVCVCLSAFAGTHEETDSSQLETMTTTMARGVANCLTFWVEVPRCLWNESVETPFLGLFTGLVDGTLLGTIRAVSGVADIASLGMTGQSIYSDSFPEYVWSSPLITEEESVE
jgi:putative exosortase-associated protein (TIGR04073 family)